MCEHSGLPYVECELCANAHAVCVHNMLLRMGCAACFNDAGDWQYGALLGMGHHLPLSYHNAYSQQRYPRARATAHDLNPFSQAPSTSFYDLGAAHLQTFNPSWITGTQPKSSLVDSLYPPGEASHMSYRSRLIKLLESPCIRDQTPDDSQYTKDFFIKGGGESGVSYRCSVKGCTETFSRLDRATYHFRTHIEHRPFECEGCYREDCHDRFYSKETRKAHMVKKMVICECGSQLEAKNFKHHQEKWCTATQIAE